MAVLMKLSNIARIKLIHARVKKFKRRDIKNFNWQLDLFLKICGKLFW